MGIMNVTPDSFSDGGEFVSVDAALKQAEKMIAEGADIIDIGGESTRPKSTRVEADEELRRTMPVIEAIVSRFDIPVSIDTTRSDVAKFAVESGAEIINDISGLRFDEKIVDVAAGSGAGLVLMHSRGTFETMHSQPPARNIVADVMADFRRSIAAAKARGVHDRQIVLDAGIGFGKTAEQNLELIAKLDKIVSEFKGYPMLIGASRKSFLATVTGNRTPASRLGESIAAALAAVRNGAMIVRVHDVRETVATLRVDQKITDLKEEL